MRSRPSSDRRRAYWQTPAARQLASQIRRDYWANPDKREAHQVIFESPEYRQKRSDIMTRCWSDPDIRERLLASLDEVRLTEDKTPMVCPHNPCETVSIGKRGLAIHLAHSHTDTFELFCDCGAGPFTAPRFLSQHITKSHISNSQLLMCECGAGPFVGQHGLGIHQSNHNGDGALMCDDCGGGPFTNARGLRVHLSKSQLHP